MFTFSQKLTTHLPKHTHTASNNREWLFLSPLLSLMPTVSTTSLCILSTFTFLYYTGIERKLSIPEGVLKYTWLYKIEAIC